MDLLAAIGIQTPLQRGIIAAAFTSGLLWHFKPYAFFREDTGQPRIASWANRRPDLLAYTTPVPWWAAVIAVGVAVDLFT